MPDAENRFRLAYSDAPMVAEADDESLTQQAIQALLASMAEMPPVAENPGAPEPQQGLSNVSKAILWGGAGVDLGSTLYALQNPALREGNPLYGDNSNPLLMAGGKIGSNLLAHWLLNKAAKKNPKAANLGAKILGGAQAGIGANNLRLALKY